MEEFKGEETFILHSMEEYNQYVDLLKDSCKYVGLPPKSFPCSATMIATLIDHVFYFRYDYVYMDEATKFLNALKKKKT